VGGADAAKVRQAGSGETLDGTEAGDTLAVFAVEMEDLLFDGDFESAAHNGEHGGKESRAITLNVTEDGKEPVSVALTLNMTLDVDSDVTMFHKEDGKWKKIRNAQNVITQANMRKPTNVNDPATWAPVYFSAGDSAPVSDLKGAFAYIDNYAEPGSGEGAVAGTPAGYSEYRIFVKAKENIINMTHLSLKDYVSIELYGAGNAGSEKIIKRDYNQSNKNMGLNYDSGINNIGGGGDHWITVSYTKPQGFSINTNHRMLTLEKNITLDGGGCDGKLIEEHTNIDARYMIAIYANGTLVMREGSKITGVISNKRAYPIIILRADSQFYMYGGEISGNRLVYSYGVGGVILLHNEATIDNVHVSTRAVIEQNYIITDPNNPNSTFEENGAATGATEIDIPRDQNL
ncbi:MAG: hypothetical protein LBP37_06175, partial [Spirochaetaceae bacterium]|nr:hypothetical protein [Spirochaetaceae bacterium]